MSENSDNNEKFDKTSIVQSDTFKVRITEAENSPPCLVLLVGPESYVGRQWPLEDTDRVLGRSEQAHISVEDRSISKSHAKLMLAGGDVSIIDLESTNCTVINGETLKPLMPRILRNNDQIKVGNIIFKFLEKGNIETVSAAQTFDRSLTDALTGINNKGALENQAAEAFKKSNLFNFPLSIVTFDIDHFKKVNDTFGHAAGDYVLKQLAQIIQVKLIRENDFFARSGGEEFTLVLLGAELSSSEKMAERIRQTIQAYEFNFGNKDMPITISVGVSVKKESDQSWNDIFNRADQALYKSKQEGRNRVNVV